MNMKQANLQPSGPRQMGQESSNLQQLTQLIANAGFRSIINARTNKEHVIIEREEF